MTRPTFVVELKAVFLGELLHDHLVHHVTAGGDFVMTKILFQNTGRLGNITLVTVKRDGAANQLAGQNGLSLEDIETGVVQNGNDTLPVGEQSSDGQLTRFGREGLDVELVIHVSDSGRLFINVKQLPINSVSSALPHGNVAGMEITRFVTVVPTTIVIRSEVTG